MVYFCYMEEFEMPWAISVCVCVYYYLCVLYVQVHGVCIRFVYDRSMWLPKLLRDKTEDDKPEFHYWWNLISMFCFVLLLHHYACVCLCVWVVNRKKEKNILFVPLFPNIALKSTMNNIKLAFSLFHLLQRCAHTSICFGLVYAYIGFRFSMIYFNDKFYYCCWITMLRY